MAVRILIIDDHAMIRKVLRRYLEQEMDFEVVGEACDGREGVAKADALHPDLILMDISMPGMDGIQATRIICDTQSRARVLILSVYDASDHVSRAVHAGARGYLLKESVAEEVVPAIRAIVGGGSYFGTGVYHAASDRLLEN
jgi:DNA-binding NarL/FixJ family response regulator